ncbi:MAG: Crp/Fnr family transcriptional regulator [Pseudomonas sp. PGPPP1]|uniref:Crp/Fnr family transcriptional regulator n=1 Tax=Pseudomonas sp. PGPPP1 TaxID=2015553 RepID=UPI000BD49032|nr:Crp/Fnr family transcriptional regulator [Pseudomonas sp. PGPPP1]OYU07312.1 MAG: Crp/Fnr family transcriptional regulator [Pseudomonas sp. PGPPP1]
MLANDQLVKQMAENQWFAGLAPALQQEMLVNSRIQRLNPGEFLLRQGDAPGCFYGLVQGALKVSTLGEDGKEAILTVFEVGNWFGETSLLDGLPRMHDMSAVTAVEVRRIEPVDFDRLMNDNGFARAIAALQAMHSRLVQKMLEDSMLRSTRMRIARRLEHLAHGDTSLSLNERHVLNITQDSLAMMLGITRQTLALELKAMAAEGAVILKYGQVHIASLPKLKAMESGL